MSERETPRDGYECVDPELGDELWQLDDPGSDAALRGRLEAHLSVCAGCRLLRAAEARTREGLREGRLVLHDDARPRRLPWTLGGGGALALAACLALVLLGPPRAPGDDLRLRADGDRPAITRPVSEEVVLGERPHVAWTPVEGATAYRVTLCSVDGAHEWAHETDASSLRVPEDAGLASSARYRILLETVPAHLAGGGVRSSFRTGTLGEFLRYRFGAAPLWVLLLGAFGAGLGGLGIASGSLRRG